MIQKLFVKYSDTMGDVYNNINGYNPNTNRNILIIFDDVVDDMSTFEISSYRQRVIYQMQKNEYISCIYYIILILIS